MIAEADHLQRAGLSVAQGQARRNRPDGSPMDMFEPLACRSGRIGSSNLSPSYSLCFQHSFASGPPIAPGAGTCSSATTMGLVFAFRRDVRHSVLELAVIRSGPPDPRLAEAPTTRIGFALSGFGTLVWIPARITPNHASGDDSNLHQFLITSAPVMSRQKGTINLADTLSRVPPSMRSGAHVPLLM